MATKVIPKNVRDFHNLSGEKLSKKLNSLKDIELVSIVKTIISKAKRDDTTAWNFAGHVISIIDTRPYAKANTTEVVSLRSKILSKSKKCLPDHGYSVEVVGIKESALIHDGREDKIIHPYPYAKVVRKVVSKWSKSKTSKTLEQYIDAYTPSKTKKAFLENSIKYLTSKEQKDYQASFSGKKIKIGKHSPHDGEYMFVLSIDQKKLLVGEKRKGKFQHSSFFAGAPIACAGNLIIKNKKIVQIRLESGHYKPSKENGELLRRYLSHSARIGKNQASHLQIKAWSH